MRVETQEPRLNGAPQESLKPSPLRLFSGRGFFSTSIMLTKPSYKYNEEAQPFQKSAVKQGPERAVVERAGTEIDTVLQSGTSPSRSNAVVSCPACRTSFSVATSCFSKGSNVAFHCSRCDTVFSAAADKPTASPGAGPAFSTQSNESAREESSLGKRIEATRTSYSHSSAVKASDFSIGNRSEGLNEGHHKASTETSTNAPRNSAASQRNIPLLSSYQDTSETAALEQDSHTAPQSDMWQPTAPREREAPLPPLQYSSSSSITEKLFSGGFEVNSPHRQTSKATPAAPPQFASAARFELTDLTATNDPQIDNDLQIDEDTFREALREQRSLAQKAWEMLSVRNRSLVVASAPLLAALGLLLALTPLASVSPHSLGALIDGVSPAVLSTPVAQIPPASLSIKKLALRFERTQSQETIAIVSGSLVNSSSTKLTGVTVEALTFNRRGEVTATSRAPLRSALAKERISDLTLETVRKFQSSLNARSASIAPGESVPFSIALLDQPESANSGEHGIPERTEVDLSKMKYFSARVFSVNQ